MRRIVFFAKHMELGGLEKALLSLLNRLADAQTDVTLVLEERHGPLLALLRPEIHVEEYRLSRCRFVPLRRLLNLSRRLLWAARNGRKYDFSCAYCTYSVIGSRLAQYASENSCLYVHSDYARSLPDEAAFRSFFDELRAGSFAKLVFVSNESLAAFRAVYPQLQARCHVINNLVDDAKIRERAAEPCPVRADGGPVFLFLGRLEEESKRLSRMLEAFRLAHAARPELRLWILGDGKDRPLCEELIEAYRLQDAVTMLGAQKNPYPCLRAADCLLLTSEYEGFPVVYTEALALGKNILTTIRVSDDAIDIADFAVLAEKDAHAIAQAMISFHPTAYAPPDYAAINAERLRRLNGLMTDTEPKN